jgi:hypothetical protein
MVGKKILFISLTVESKYSEIELISNTHLLKSQEYDSDCVRSIEIELLDDDQSHHDGELIPYIYSDSRVGTPQKY